MEKQAPRGFHRDIFNKSSPLSKHKKNVKEGFLLSNHNQ